MATNLEKYMGLKLLAQEELDSLRLASLKERLLLLEPFATLDWSEFFIYVHRLEVIQCDGRFPKTQPLSHRLRQLWIRIVVNEKQLRRGMIRFYNEEAKMEAPAHAKLDRCTGSSIVLRYSAETLKKYSSFSTHLITFVSRKLRRSDHKKLKMIALAEPTENHSLFITNKLAFSRVTKLDLRLVKAITINTKRRSREELEEVTSLIEGSTTNGRLSPIRNILYFSANPLDLDQFRVADEIREIQLRLGLPSETSMFALTILTSVRSLDLIRGLTRTRPEIVHLSAHGLSSGDICLDDEHGVCRPLEPGRFVELLGEYSHTIKCVLLSVCNSSRLAEHLSTTIDYTIAFEGQPADAEAIEFAKGFYEAIAAGCGFDQAFRLGCNALTMLVPSPSCRPVLKSRTMNRIDDKRQAGHHTA